jgi:hypothetical protein
VSEKEAEKLMYAIGDVSEEMLKEAEDYSENIKKISFRQKRLKKYAKTVFAIGTAAAVIGCALLVYEKPKKSYKNDLRPTGQNIEKNYDKWSVTIHCDSILFFVCKPHKGNLCI